MTNEHRLDELRERARMNGAVSGRGVDIAGGPIPRKAGYYGEMVVRPPVWTWEIPVYFFVGGLAGMSAVIAAAAAFCHHLDIARTALIVAVAAAIISPILLILDLGRPRRFINMLRVFKPQSPMSMGAWILVAFSACVMPALIALELHVRGAVPGPMDTTIRIITAGVLTGSAITGALLATYTGVLIGATTIPAWFSHHIMLPIHFGTAGLGSAAGVLELLGYRIAALNVIGFFAAAVETVVVITLLVNRRGDADRALRNSSSGLLLHVAELLTGPFPLVLRALSFIPLAAISFVVGSMLSRFGWIWAGRISGRDPEAVFASQRR